MLTYAGMMLDEKGKYDAAEMLYRRVLQVEPKHLDCYCTYGLLLDRHGISQLYLLYWYKSTNYCYKSTNTDANAPARASRIGDAHV